MLTYLKAHLGEFVPYQRLRDVGEMDDVPRLLRQFRADGWPIEIPGDATARLLPQVRGLPRHDGAQITANQRARILARDRRQCCACGRGAGDVDDRGDVVVLEVHHIIPRDQGGPTTDENLETLCRRDHHARHA